MLSGLISTKRVDMLCWLRIALGNVRYAFSKLNSKIRFIDLSFTGLQEHSAEDIVEKILLFCVRKLSKIQVVFALPTENIALVIFYRLTQGVTKDSVPSCSSKRTSRTSKEGTGFGNDWRTQLYSLEGVMYVVCRDTRSTIERTAFAIDNFSRILLPVFT